MPINEKKMRALVKEYGAKKGKEVYYAMEQKAKKSAKKKHGMCGKSSSKKRK